MRMKKPTKPILKRPLEEVEDFVREAKRQIGAKPLAPEELLVGGGPGVSQKQVQKIQQAEEQRLRELRMKKAKMLAKWRRRREKMDRELEAITQKKKIETEEKKRAEEEIKKKEEKAMPSGEQAIAATGATQKRPTGLWGIGGRFKKLFKWFTPERRGRAPR